MTEEQLDSIHERCRAGTAGADDATTLYGEVVRLRAGIDRLALDIEGSDTLLTGTIKYIRDRLRELL